MTREFLVPAVLRQTEKLKPSVWGHGTRLYLYLKPTLSTLYIKADTHANFRSRWDGSGRALAYFIKLNTAFSLFYVFFFFFTLTPNCSHGRKHIQRGESPLRIAEVKELYGMCSLSPEILYQLKYVCVPYYILCTISELARNKTNNKTCATREDPGQTARSLIRVFADRKCLLQPQALQTVMNENSYLTGWMYRLI